MKTDTKTEEKRDSKYIVTVDRVEDVPEGFKSRGELLEELDLNVKQHQWSYAARHGHLGNYYAFGSTAYYSRAAVIKKWGSAQQKAALKRRKGAETDAGLAKPLKAKDMGTSLKLLNREEVAVAIERTPEELDALLAEDKFIGPAATLSATGELLWLPEHVEAWLGKNPPPPVTLVFDGETVKVDRALKPGTYKLTKE